MIGVRAPRLRRGDRVMLASPASIPAREDVMRGAAMLATWGLEVEFGAHAFDRFGHYLAGADADRLADLNRALRDPGIRAIFCTRGGKGSYRIAHGLDFEAARGDPKPLVGYSDITMLHLARWHRSRLVGLHGPHMAWSDDWYGVPAAESLRRALMEPDTIVIRQNPAEPTAGVNRSGTATGVLLGGTLGVIAGAVGWMCPSFRGAILLIEAVDAGLGQIDTALTQLIRSGVLDGVKAVAVGQFLRCGEPAADKWSVVDVLEDRLSQLNVPVLGGLPIGHGQHPLTVPLGVTATLDTAAGTLTVAPGLH